MVPEANDIYSEFLADVARLSMSASLDNTAMQFSSWSWNAGSSLYPLRNTCMCVKVCPISLDVLRGLGESL